MTWKQEGYQLEENTRNRGGQMDDNQEGEELEQRIYENIRLTSIILCVSESKARKAMNNLGLSRVIKWGLSIIYFLNKEWRKGILGHVHRLKPSWATRDCVSIKQKAKQTVLFISYFPTHTAADLKKNWILRIADRPMEHS